MSNPFKVGDLVTPANHNVDFVIHGANYTVIDVDELTYEEKKANARVTSEGPFDKGDVLVYRDRTPTLTDLTVTWCTATAVCFEETYSMPFNPEEFVKVSEAQYD